MPRSAGTREQLLEVAERLFGEQGYRATSARQITLGAGANIAAINYHFGGKAKLLQAVLERRLEPVNRERLRRLEEAERRAATAPPALEDILQAFLAPALQRGATPDNPVAAVSRLIGRLHAEAHTGLSEVLLPPFEAVMRRYLDVLAKVLPDLSAAELFLRMRFAVGVMIHVVTGLEEAQKLREYAAAPAAPDLVGPMVAFLAEGFRAPATLPPDGEDAG